MAALASLGTVILMDLPATQRYLPVWTRNRIAHILILFLVLFVTQAALDMFLKIGNKGCHILDALLLAVFGILGYGIYEGLKRVPVVSMALQPLANNPILNVLMAGSSVALAVFIWKILIRQFMLPC
jgi:hypothetical protein